jgi:hypothetical protein
VLADFRKRVMLQGSQDEERKDVRRDGKIVKRFAIAKNALAMKMQISQIEQLAELTGVQIEKLQQ